MSTDEISIQKGSRVRATRDIFLVPVTSTPAASIDPASDDKTEIKLNVSKGTLGVVDEVCTNKLYLVYWGTKSETDFALLGEDCELVVE